MEALIWETAEELDKNLALRVRKIRKRRKISQQKLADLSGVSYGSIKRFETSGQISLLALTKIAWHLIWQTNAEHFFPGTVQKYSGGNK